VVVHPKSTRCSSCRSTLPLERRFYVLYRARGSRSGPWLAEVMCDACRCAMLDSDLWSVHMVPMPEQARLPLALLPRPA
jgi:hypothetical protein